MTKLLLNIDFLEVGSANRDSAAIQLGVSNELRLRKVAAQLFRNGSSRNVRKHCCSAASGVLAAAQWWTKVAHTTVSHST